MTPKWCQINPKPLPRALPEHSHSLTTPPWHQSRLQDPPVPHFGPLLDHLGLISSKNNEMFACILLKSFRKHSCLAFQSRSERISNSFLYLNKFCRARDACPAATSFWISFCPPATHFDTNIAPKSIPKPSTNDKQMQHKTYTKSIFEIIDFWIQNDWLQTTGIKASASRRGGDASAARRLR